MRFLFHQCEVSKRELFIVGIIVFILFAGILFVSGELYDSYHFVDDHEVLAISAHVNQHPIVDTVRWFAMKDFSIRFRPLYNIELVLQTYILGTNMNYWILLSMFEGIVSFVLFYFFARKLMLVPLLAFLFSGLIHFGGQFTPWFRALNQENLAMVLLGATLCCLGAKNRLATVFAVFFAVLSALQKESFSLLLPAYPLVHFFFEQKIIEGLSVKEYVRRHTVFIAVLLGVFALIIYCIVFCVGMNQIGYAGFGGGTPLMVYVKTLAHSMVRSMYYLAPFTVYAVWITLKYYHENGIEKKYVTLIVCGMYVILSQLALHLKSGIWERYLLPFMIGWAILFVFIPSQLALREKYKKIFWCLCISTLLLGVVKSYDVAANWAGIGSANRLLLNAIEKRIASVEEATLLFYIDGCELDVGARDWIRFFVKQDLKVTIYKYDKVPAEPIPEYPIVVLNSDKENDKIFFDMYHINKDSYLKEYIGNNRETYVVLYKENEGNS